MVGGGEMPSELSENDNNKRSAMSSKIYEDAVSFSLLSLLLSICCVGGI